MEHLYFPKAIKIISISHFSDEGKGGNGIYRRKRIKYFMRASDPQNLKSPLPRAGIWTKGLISKNSGASPILSLNHEFLFMFGIEEMEESEKSSSGLRHGMVIESRRHRRRLSFLLDEINLVFIIASLISHKVPVGEQFSRRNF